MKKINIINLFGLIILALLLGLSSCKPDFDRPPFDEPKAEWVPNTTISELLENFDATNVYIIPDSTYISGYVGGNDISGNIYKKIYIQDATAGVELEIDMTNIHALYPVGQKLVIDLAGLVLGSYGNAPQIGLQGNGTQAARMTEKDCLKHIQKDGFPNINNVEPKVLTIAEINASGMAYIGMLVKIEDAQFANAGEPFAIAGSTTNRPIVDGTGSLDLRNSSFSDFASDFMPSGTGSVSGCLGIFNGGYQLFLRSKSDVFETTPGPSNLQCVVEGNTIHISFVAPFGVSPLYYKIYLDGEEKAKDVKDTKYDLTNVPSGFYTVGVSAVYADRESAMITKDNVIIN